MTRTRGNNYTVQRYGKLLTRHHCQCAWFAIFSSPPFRNFLFSKEKLRENKGCLAFISTCSDNCIRQLKPNCCMYMFWVLWKNYMAWPLKYSLLRTCCISVLSSFFINFTPSSSRCSDCYDLFFFTRSCCYRLLLTSLRRVTELSDLVHTLLLMSWFYC